MGFRIALGSGDCSKQTGNALRDDLCKRVRWKLEHLRALSPEELFLLEGDVEEISVGPNRGHLSIYRETTTVGTALIVVQGFVSTLRWPTFIGETGVGHIVADGFLVDSAGNIRTAPDDLLWEYR